MRKLYIYGETAFHHEGDFQYLLKMIDLCAESGLNGVKFQVLIDPLAFISSGHSSFSVLKNYCFTPAQWKQVFDYTISKRLDVIAMPLDIGACDLIATSNVKFVDIHSVSFNDSVLLNAVKATAVPLILGVGGRTQTEVEQLISYFNKQVAVLMCGFQSFPSLIEEVRLGKIAQFKKTFPGFNIGYADHSSFDSEFCITSNDYAYLLGATYFEKHITLNEGVKRVDYDSAVGQSKLLQIVRRLRLLQELVKEEEDLQDLNEAEIRYKNRELKCVASIDLPAGIVITAEHVRLKLADEIGDFITKQELVIGKKLIREIKKDSLITKDNLV